MGVPLVAGRILETADTHGAEPVVLINDAMRRRYWAGKDPLGGRLKVGGLDSNSPWLRVVGVVGDVHQAALDVDSEPEVMLPYRQYTGAAVYRPGSLVVRTAVEAEVLIDEVRREIEVVDSSIPVVVQTMGQVAAAGLDERRLCTGLISVFAAIALALSVLGFTKIDPVIALQRIVHSARFPSS